MSETWLRPNTRALALGMLMPALATALLAVWLSGIVVAPPVGWFRLAAGLLLSGGVFLLVALLIQMRQPRLAIADGSLLVNLRSGSPLRVPLEIVEGFLLGQSPTLLPGKRHRQSETRTIVIRLADRAEEWSHIDVKPSLGKWCDGYITIRGTWCEPLSVDLVNRLNARLAEVQRAERESQVAE
jgi:hypothetical protein